MLWAHRSAIFLPLFTTLTARHDLLLLVRHPVTNHTCVAAVPADHGACTKVRYELQLRFFVIRPDARLVMSKRLATLVTVLQREQRRAANRVREKEDVTTDQSLGAPGAKMPQWSTRCIAVLIFCCVERAAYLFVHFCAARLLAAALKHL